MYPDPDDTERADDGEDRPRRDYPPSPARMSKVPSWISLGMVIGALIGWTLKPVPKPNALEVRLDPAPTRAKAEPQPTKLTTVEAVFEAWGQYAVWDHDATQIAYWNPGTQDFTEFYEVRRAGDALYFRSIPKLTRRIILHGKEPPAECPLRFTETEAQYREWQESRVERAAPKVSAPSPTTTIELVQPEPVKIQPAPISPPPLQIEGGAIELPKPASGK